MLCIGVYAMKTRAVIAAFALSAVVLGSGVPASAYNGPCNGPDRIGMPSLSPEKRDAYETMMKDFHNRVSPLYDAMSGKSLELKALSRNPKVMPETLSKLANEVAELRSRLQAERMALGDKMEKELGVRPGYGMMGNGIRHHNGGRPNGHGGYGPNCGC